MRILLAGVFYPQVGGMERMLEVVAGELARRGHEIHVMTPSASPCSGDRRTFSFPVSWRPTSRQALALQRWADVGLHFGMGLRLAWPALLSGAPLVVSHQFPYETAGPTKRGREFLKNWLTRWVTNISASRAIAATIPGSSIVIPNCYDDAVFSQRGEETRSRDFAFVGRLVSLKGVDLMLEALGRLEQRGLRPNLTIIGDGPERARLEELARPFGSRVVFRGSMQPAAIAAVLREHRVLVVPSRWNEPFGIVALEGIACGCVVVGSAGGGLPEAIGPCGLTYPNGDAAALAAGMQQAWQDLAWQAQARASAADHLREHTAAAVAARYESVLIDALARHQTGRRPARAERRVEGGRASLLP